MSALLTSIELSVPGPSEGEAAKGPAEPGAWQPWLEVVLSRCSDEEGQVFGPGVRSKAGSCAGEC